MSTTARRTQAERQEATRLALIAVGQDSLAAGELDKPISTLCKEANVAVGSFYNYFDSKSELFEQAALAALNDYQPTMQKIVDRYEDSALGLLASFRHNCRLSEHNPRLARIIVNAGPSAFTKFNEYSGPPAQALKASVDKGHAKCENITAFLVAVSGAFQNVLAFSLSDAGFDPAQADYAMSIFARELGYSDEVIQKVCFGK